MQRYLYNTYGEMFKDEDKYRRYRDNNNTIQGHAWMNISY